jgi:hypothetical protein
MLQLFEWTARRVRRNTSTLDGLGRTAWRERTLHPSDWRPKVTGLILAAGFVCSVVASATLPEGTSVSISDDKQSLVLQFETKSDTKSTPVLNLKDFSHRPSAVAPDFNLDSKELRDAKLSPDRKLIAFTVTGNTHDWIGILTLGPRMSARDVDVLFEGTATGPIAWSPDATYLAVEAVPASGLRTIRIIDASQSKPPASLSVLISKDLPVETYAPSWDGNVLIFKKKMSESAEEKPGRFSVSAKAINPSSKLQ